MIRARGSVAAFILMFALAQAASAAPPRQESTPRGAEAVTAQASDAGPETALDAQTRDVASALRCPVCQGLSLQDSPSELAQEMRDVIRDQLRAGRTPEQVKAYFVGRYGEWILLEPEAHGFNLAVYILPVLAVLAGLVLVFAATGRWVRRTPTAGNPSVPAEEDPDLAPWDEIAHPAPH